MAVMEQRQLERIPILFQAKCRNKDAVGALFRRAELLDIHHQGCRFLAASYFERNTILSMTVDLTPEGPLYLEGVVAWSKPVCPGAFETGVHFLINDPTAQETHRKLVHFCLYNTPYKRRTPCI